MRRRGVIILVGVAVASVAVRGAVAWLDWRDEGKPAEATASGLPSRSLNAGEIDIKIEPRQLNDQGAVFAITLDTHSVDLSADLTRATLEVAGVTWPVEGWSGDGPGGHHREGDLRFESAGTVAGTARLALPGFPEPVEVTWELGG